MLPPIGAESSRKGWGVNRAVLLLLLTLSGLGQLDYGRKVAWNLPDEARKRLEKVKFFDYYELSDAVNPFYLRADFDGDGKPDYAILVVGKNTDNRVIAICRSGSPNVEILTDMEKSVVFDPKRPAGSVANFNWMDAWQIVRRRKLGASELNEKTPPPMVGEGILVEKTESASAIIYWTGTRYYRYQTSD